MKQTNHQKKRALRLIESPARAIHPAVQILLLLLVRPIDIARRCGVSPAKVTAWSQGDTPDDASKDKLIALSSEAIDIATSVLGEVAATHPYLTRVRGYKAYANRVQQARAIFSGMENATVEVGHEQLQARE